MRIFGTLKVLQLSLDPKKAVHVRTSVNHNLVLKCTCLMLSLLCKSELTFNLENFFFFFSGSKFTQVRIYLFFSIHLSTGFL